MIKIIFFINLLGGRTVKLIELPVGQKRAGGLERMQPGDGSRGRGKIFTLYDKSHMGTQVTEML